MSTRQTSPVGRRAFFGSTCGALGILPLAGPTASVADDRVSAPAKVSAELQARREKLLNDMQARRGIGVPRADGDFLHLMVHATRAQRVFEVGTYRGYSGVRMALGLEETGGRLTTIEIDPERLKEAKGNFAKAGLLERITALEGDAHELAKSVEGPLDLVFLDAEKGNDVDYFSKLFPKLGPGGFLLLHNAISSAKVMQPYLELVSRHPEIVHVVLSLSMSDGFSVSLRKRRT